MGGRKDWSSSPMFGPETWQTLQRMAERVGQIPPTRPNDPPNDGFSGDREPRNPKPIAPIAGAIALKLAITNEDQV